MTRTNLVWARRWPNNTLNYDLILTNPEMVDVAYLRDLLQNIRDATHRGLGLAGDSIREWDRWLTDPRSPIKAAAYVLMSNWFCTGGGDKSSELARRCETFWDAAFAERPVQRLSSPLRGQNHRVIPDAFDEFWGRLLIAQGHPPTSAGNESSPAESPSGTRSAAAIPPTIWTSGATSQEQTVKVEIEGNKFRCKAEGTPRLISELLHLLENGHELSVPASSKDDLLANERPI